MSSSICISDGLLIACDKCDKLVLPETYIDHSKRCTIQAKILDSKIKSGDQPKNQSKDQSDNQSKSLTVNEPTKSKKVKKIETDNIDHNPFLNEIQQKAVSYCFKKARIYHKNVYPNAVIKFIELGLSEQDLFDTLEYIKGLDAIIHFGGPGKVNWIKTEDKVKNAYEVNRDASYLVSRTTWENNLFNKIYGENTDDVSRTNRVKYGCINMLCDPIGCLAAKTYGPSYMILKKEVKSRTSFVCGDSAGLQQHICTFDNCVQLLLYMDDILLKNVVKMVKLKKMRTVTDEIKEISGSRNYNYVEIQVHGDIHISRDVECVVLDKQSMSKEEMREVVRRLKSDNVNYIISDQGVNPHNLHLPFRPTFL